MAMIHDIVFLWIWLYLYLFVNSPSPLLVSEAGHQKGRENKSGPARHCLSYITLHCTLHVAHCTAKPFLYHTSLHIAHYISLSYTTLTYRGAAEKGMLVQTRCTRLNPFAGKWLCTTCLIQQRLFSFLPSTTGKPSTPFSNVEIVFVQYLLEAIVKTKNHKKMVEFVVDIACTFISWIFMLSEFVILFAREMSRHVSCHTSYQNISSTIPMFWCWCKKTPLIFWKQIYFFLVFYFQRDCWDLCRLKPLG